MAIIKIREDEENKGSSNGFQIFACLPEEGDDPVENCQVASYIHSDEENRKTLKSATLKKEDEVDNNLRILAHDVKFGPSIACSDETPNMRGYLDDHQNILCTENTEGCNRLIRGPVFCQNHDQVYITWYIYYMYIFEALILYNYNFTGTNCVNILGKPVFSCWFIHKRRKLVFCWSLH